MQKIEFTKAARTAIHLNLGLFGPSGSGKTMSALEIATGIGGPIAFIDTEEGRGNLYADDYDYSIVQLRPPFSPERYIEMIDAAEQFVGPEGTVIVDSVSHVWEGSGGLREQAARIAEDMAQRASERENRTVDPERYTFASWNKPKQSLTKLVVRLQRMKCHIILCMRGKEKLKQVKNGRRTEIVPVGIVPICPEEIPFDCTAVARFHSGDGNAGIPDWSFKQIHKDIRPLFPSGKPMSAEEGRKLALWCNKGEVEAAASPEKHALIDENGLVHGEFTLREWWSEFKKLEDVADVNQDVLKILLEKTPKDHKMYSEIRSYVFPD